MAMQGLAILALAAVGLYAFSRTKDKGKLPSMLSDDCTKLLVTSGSLDALRWQDNYVSAHPLPQPPSDPETLRDWLAPFVSAFMRDAAPQCTKFFQVPYEEWPLALQVLYERLVFNASLWLDNAGYDVAIPAPPKEF